MDKFIPRRLSFKIVHNGKHLEVSARENNDGHAITYVYVADPAYPDDELDAYDEFAATYGELDAPDEHYTSIKETAWHSACKQAEQVARHLSD